MAQIVVRGIDDHLMAAFKARAKRRGVSAEQAVRQLIEDAARMHVRETDWLQAADSLRGAIARAHGVLASSSEAIRADRDAR